jgi:hypothetical protein
MPLRLPRAMEENQMVGNERSPVTLRSTLVADLQVGDHIVVDGKHIGIVASKSRTFFKNMPYVDVSYIGLIFGSDTEEKTRRYFTDSPTKVTQILLSRGGT